MYRNIGNTLKICSLVIGWGGLIVSVIAAVAVAADGDPAAAGVWIASGLGDFLFSLILYAFGQLVEDTHALRRHTVPEQAEAPSAGASEPRKRSDSAADGKGKTGGDEAQEPDRQKSSDSEATADDEDNRLDTFDKIVVVGVVALVVLAVIILGVMKAF